MRIQKDRVVSLAYTLKNAHGELLEAAQREAPFRYLHGHHALLPTLEEALGELGAGDHFVLRLSPDEAFGPYNPDFRQRVPRQYFPKELKLTPGMMLEVVSDPRAKRSPEEDDTLVVYVSEVFEEDVVIDANHPLAGESLVLEGHVTEVREASFLELLHESPEDSNYPQGGRPGLLN